MPEYEETQISDAEKAEDRKRALTQYREDFAELKKASGRPLESQSPRVIDIIPGTAYAYRAIQAALSQYGLFNRTEVHEDEDRASLRATREEGTLMKDILFFATLAYVGGVNVTERKAALKLDNVGKLVTNAEIDTELFPEYLDKQVKLLEQVVEETQG